MFRSLGFDPEALLTDHVRDQSGALRDLMILAHSVEEQWSSMVVAGIADELSDARDPRIDELLEAVINGYEDVIRRLRPAAHARAGRRSSRRGRSSTRRRTSRGTSPCSSRVPAGCSTHDVTALGEHRHRRARADDHGLGLSGAPGGEPSPCCRDRCASSRSTTAGGGHARACTATRPRRWPTTPPRCSTRPASSARTCTASRSAAWSRSNWRCGTPSACARSCSGPRTRAGRGRCGRATR